VSEFCHVSKLDDTGWTHCNDGQTDEPKRRRAPFSIPAIASDFRCNANGGNGARLACPAACHTTAEPAKHLTDCNALVKLLLHGGGAQPESNPAESGTARWGRRLAAAGGDGVTRGVDGRRAEDNATTPRRRLLQQGQQGQVALAEAVANLEAFVGCRNNAANNRQVRMLADRPCNDGTHELHELSPMDLQVSTLARKSVCSSRPLPPRRRAH
jgi:hypothetical protein